MKELLDNRKYYLSEFSLFDGERHITFNIVNIDTVREEITVAVTNEGKLSVCSFPLYADSLDCLYFEYGVMCDRIAVDDFEHIGEGRNYGIR